MPVIKPMTTAHKATYDSLLDRGYQEYEAFPDMGKTVMVKGIRNSNYIRYATIIKNGKVKFSNKLKRVK